MPRAETRASADGPERQQDGQDGLFVDVPAKEEGGEGAVDDLEDKVWPGRAPPQRH